MSSLDFKSIIRDVPDFPKPGIVFKDITPLLNNHAYFNGVINVFTERYQALSIQKIICIESRGFIFGAPLACRLGAGLIPVRKKGKLPCATISATYALEYGTDTLEMHQDALNPSDRVLIVDDLLATGGTVGAVADLVSRQGAHILGMAFLIELGFLNGRTRFSDIDVFSLITY